MTPHEPGMPTEPKQETIAAVEELGYPVVLKLMAEDVVHKSDTGAVKLNLNSLVSDNDLTEQVRDYKETTMSTG